MGIVIRNLSFSYEEAPVLLNINLTVHTGESVGIVGVSGGGKSTLLKLVSGLYDVTDGEILLGARESTTSRDSAARRKLVAMVMQNANLFPASIRDNITCGHDISEADIAHACEAAMLTEWINTLPQGLDTFVGERNGKVSGGQAQRIAIARAMAKNAPVILLDEPTSALDNDTGDAVISALARLARNKTVLHVSHKPETLACCNRILRLEGGQL